jgi:hypothetical protein
MSEVEKPVWVWLPAQSLPVRCGTFSLSRGVGTFHYDDDYLVTQSTSDQPLFAGVGQDESRMRGLARGSDFNELPF